MPLWLLTAVASAVCTVIAVISFAPKDREEFFGTGKYVPGLMGTLFPFVDKIISSLAYGLIIVGLICNLIAMKFYPLTKE